MVYFFQSFKMFYQSSFHDADNPLDKVLCIMGFKGHYDLLILRLN